MIKIVFTPPVNDPVWDRWRTDCDAETQAVEAALNARQFPDITALYRRDPIRKSFYFSTTSCFFGKCAYCEGHVTHTQRPDIEHYRPKAAVTDENDNPVQVDYGRGPEPHRGYRWLAYSLDNLLPSCQLCNQATVIQGDKIGKHNRFPVAGAYAISAIALANEHPLLINPLTEDPETEIGVNLRDGTLFGINASVRGEITIKVLGHNVRDQLREGRLGKINEVRGLLGSLIHAPTDAEKNSALQKLKAMKAGASEYAIVVRAVLRDHQAALSTLATP